MLEKDEDEFRDLKNKPLCEIEIVKSENAFINQWYLIIVNYIEEQNERRVSTIGF